MTGVMEKARLKKGEQRRESVVQAAFAVIREKGPRALTLDAVAKEAGISKGGLIHHFATKEALVEALMISAVDTLRGRLEAAFEASAPAGPGRFTRSYIQTTLEHAGESYLLLLFELVAADPRLARPLAEHNAWVHASLERDGLDPVLAHILASAADALWSEIVFGVERPDSARVQDMKARLLQLATPEQA